MVCIVVQGHAFVRRFEASRIHSSLICWQEGPHFGAANQVDPLQRAGVTHLDEGSAPDCKVARCKTQRGSLSPTCTITSAGRSRTTQGWIPICRLSRPPVRSWLVPPIPHLHAALTQIVEMPDSLVCRHSRHASTPRRPHFERTLSSSVGGGEAHRDKVDSCPLGMSFGYRHCRHASLHAASHNESSLSW
jgi:hypothetical protein